MVQNAITSNAAQAIFWADLAKWGPDNPPAACTLPFALQHCRRIARSHYENFTVVSWFLPRTLRQDFYNFYAFCRWSDDIADEVEEHRRLPMLNWWQQQLNLCYSGRPAHPVMLALQQTIQRHQVPVDTLEDLLSAFRQDQSTLRYRDDPQLLDYCRRSANPVGRVILKFSKADDATNIELSDWICTGLQLANFCQDMSRDAANNRIYAPSTLWSKHGVTEEMILDAKRTPQLQAMLGEWVYGSRECFSKGRKLVDRVPKWLAVDVDLFIRGGLGILNVIEANGYDVWTSRPTLSKFAKFCLLCQSLAIRLSRKSLHG
jgi:squalene synthase HpnC